MGKHWFAYAPLCFFTFPTGELRLYLVLRGFLLHNMKMLMLPNEILPSLTVSKFIARSKNNMLSGVGAPLPYERT